MIPHPKAWWLVIVLAITSPLHAADATLTPEQLAFFEKKIRPVLVAHCYKCHSATADKIKGELALDTRAGVQQGGESGPLFVPGQPAKSLLIQALKWEKSAPAMPPKEQLPESVIDDFERWITMGAPDPRDGKAAFVKQEIDIEKGRQFWAFVPPKSVEPPVVKDAAWPKTLVDRFLLAAMESKGLKPVADANAYSLVRRLHFDLTGLPPSVEDVESFVKASAANPQKVLEAEVDRLLASPHFGERWGRHWLDVVRYAETSGRQINFNYPHAWRYRDYVIAAFNADKPFDQFVKEQIAGDLMPSNDPKVKAERIIATGFLAIGPKAHSERNALQYQMDVADEQIDATTQAFLGLSVACARCHDHKFDPIPQEDYYALAGIFRSSETCYGTIRVIQSVNLSPLIDLPEGADVPEGVARLTPEARKELERSLAEIKDRAEKAAKEGKQTTGVDYNNKALGEYKLTTFTDDGKPKLRAMGMRERAKPADCPLYIRGEVEKPGTIVPRGVPQVVMRERTKIAPESSGRRELADWLASRNNPLTARVFVNRVWLHLFSRGLVTSPDNFGASGSPPDHPQLLDHLATTFMDDGWSVKRLVRRLVLSHAYRLAETHDAKNFEVDPDAVLVWRKVPRRLEAEELRDALLDVAGKLDRTPQVGSPIADNGEGGSNGIIRKVVQLDRENLHRAVYLPIIRDNILESLALFDFPDASLVTGQRSTTNVPSQGLYLLNGPFVLTQAEAAADRLLAEGTDDGVRLKRAYLRFLGRPPTEKERQASEAFLKNYPELLAKDGVQSTKRTRTTWTALCQGLIASADFLFCP